MSNNIRQHVENKKYQPDFADLLGNTPVEKKTVKPKDAQAPTGAVSGRELALFWGVSTRQVAKLVDEAAIQKLPSGLFDLSDSTQRYIQRLVASAKLRNGADPDLRAEKLRLTREQADKIEIANATARRELVPAAEVEREWSSVLRDIRAALLAVPSRVGSRVSTLSAHDIGEIDREIRDVLQEISE